MPLKMKFFIICCLFQLIQFPCFPQLQSPLENNNYQKVTSYEEIRSYIRQLDEQSDLLTIQIIGQSVKNRDLFALQFSKSGLGKDQSKIRLIIFAQQHGNEQSGKEGALLLAKELSKEENKYLFDKIDLAIIPQMNPDGSELNQRRNSNDMDLNRNHLIMSEPEIIALHKFFDKYQFEVNMDIHEYSPYGEEWIKYGYRKNADITLGVNTNPNVSQKIRDFSNNELAPYVLKYIKDKGFSSFVYCPGGPPNLDYFRHSTFDINDGRQSFGIQNTFSFIQEGMNGVDNNIENINRRTHGQLTGMLAMLEFVYQHAVEMKKIVSDERKALISGQTNQIVSIQDEHIGNGQKLLLPLYSYYSKTDSIVEVTDYRPVVKSIYDVQKPFGYLVPTQLKEVISWVKRHGIEYSKFKSKKKYLLSQYDIGRIDSIDFEGDIIIDPFATERTIKNRMNESNYIFIPTSQLKGNMIVIALEPKSMLGLVTYKQYQNLLKSGEVFPILKVTLE